MADIGNDLTGAYTAGDGESRGIVDIIKGSLAVVAGLLAAMWAIEVVDTFILRESLQENGIRPRTSEGLDGILWSPFLHSGFPHLISNTPPFLVLSALTLTGGLARYLKASAMIIVLGGAMVWAFAIGSNENHIGASGWVFGLVGFLLAAAVIEKKPVTIAVGLVALFFYWSFIFGFVPKDGISWEGHLFGFIAGILAAKVVVSKRDLPSLQSLQPPEIS